MVPEYSNNILGINSHMKGIYTGERFESNGPLVQDFTYI